MIAAGVGLNHTGIDSKGFALDEARIHGCTNYSFEHMTEND
jgi:hypothetical protein